MENVSNHLNGERREELLDCLFEHKSEFGTPENPSLGLTREVEYVIHLNSDAKINAPDALQIVTR